MNFAEIEKLRSQIASLLPRISGMPRVILLNHFYSKLLETNDTNLIDAFCNEFIPVYLTSLEDFSPEFSEPQKSNNQIHLLNSLNKLQILAEYHDQIGEIKYSIITKRDKFLEQLKGNDSVNHEKGELYFPLIGSISVGEDILKYSSIERVKVKITPAKEKDAFLVVPSNHKNSQLVEQAKTSFEIAKQYLKQNKYRINKHHEVLIYFENLSAEYVGNSLGIALTIGFIERFSFIYNLPYIIHIKSRIASTGGMNYLGDVTSIGAYNISCKVETAFYSNCESLIIPEADEVDAKQKLNQLKKIYPNRLLRLIPVESLTDLLERRNIVDIKKQSPIVRTARSIKNNWLVTFLLLLLTLILIFVYVRDYDENPAILERDKTTLLIKNKYGIILWTKKMNFWGPDNESLTTTPTTQKLIDIDADDKNELIFASNTSTNAKLMAVDYKGNEIWKYICRDTVTSESENLFPPYYYGILDTVTINGQKQLICFVVNQNSFSSAIIKLDLKTGTRLNGTLWNSGFVVDGFLDDIDKDGSKELVFDACNNGYDKASLAVINLSELTGTKILPTTPSHRILYFPLVKVNSYLLFPNSDYNTFLNTGLVGMIPGYLRNNTAQKTISIWNFQNKTTSGVRYKAEYDLLNITVHIDDEFSQKRDSLVRVGKLSYPLTDTKEYRELLRRQILAWDGVKFIPIDELKKKRAAK